MSNDLASFLSNHCSTGADPAALALVAATVPLPKPTAAALRLVCQATKMAVDTEFKTIHLFLDSAEGLRAVANPLTSGLQVLTFHGFNEVPSETGIFNACLMALNSCSDIQVLHLLPNLSFKQKSTARVALGLLGTQKWPKLLQLIIPSIPSIFTDCIKVDLMPALQRLGLGGSLSWRDVAALRSGTHFRSTIEVLDFAGSVADTDLDLFDKEINGLLQGAPQMRKLTLDIDGYLDVDFLVDAELPNVELLQLSEVDIGLCLHRITRVARPRLHTLTLRGPDVEDPDDVVDELPLLSGALCALQKLDITN